jgi:hypothetical protein
VDRTLSLPESLAPLVKEHSRRAGYKAVNDYIVKVLAEATGWTPETSQQESLPMAEAS